jgi:hypothetical protein
MRNPISIEAFAEFCERKPAGEVYEYGDFANCAVAQYCRTLGIEYSVAALPRVVNNGFEKPVGFWQTAELCAVKASTRTFGDLAQRLRAAMAEG